MDIKKTPVSDIYKHGIKEDLTSIYKKLNQVLGEDANPFAEFKIGSGIYVWSDLRNGWKPKNEASEMLQGFIVEAERELHAKIKAKIGAKTADALFTVPDDSYIFYKEDNGSIKILFTGWGFKKPVRVVGGKDEKTISVPNEISVSFLHDGMPIPNYEFGLQLAKQVKRLTTNEFGIWSQSLKIGEVYTLIDIKNNNKEYQLEVVAGKSNYEFDVTTYAEITVSATEDDKPIANESVAISYKGRQYDVITDANGRANTKVPYYEGTELRVEMRGTQKSEIVNCDVIPFNFAFENIVETDILVTVAANGVLVPNKHIEINYNGIQFAGVTDDNGQFKQHVRIKDSELCEVGAEGYENIVRPLEVKDINRFDFNISTPPPFAEFNPHILVLGNGTPLSNYPIRVEYNRMPYDYVTDVNGVIQLSNVEPNKMMIVVDGQNPIHQEAYELNASQDEYIFEVNNEQPQIKVMIRDVEGRPMKCDKVRFQQPGQDAKLVTLDVDGNTYFANNTFNIGTPILVTILDETKSYDPISFTLEPGETEYLLQEQNKISWLMILLEVLFVLLTIVGLYFIWRLFEHYAPILSNLINL